MDFEWDAEKEAANAQKHGVSFAEAAELFGDPLASTVHDPDHSEEEDRYVIFGKSEKGRYLVAVFTDRDGRIRLISARQMTRRERIAYEQ